MRSLPWFEAASCAALTLVAILVWSCGEDNSGPDPEESCEELCGHNKCPSDVTDAQCQSTCLEWYDLCSRKARVFVGCANSNFEANFICDEGTTRLADGLCVKEDQELRDCLNRDEDQ